jgi:hypothetical protein
MMEHPCPLHMQKLSLLTEALSSANGALHVEARRYPGEGLARLAYRFGKRKKLEWSRAFLDGSFVPAKKGS